MITTMGRQKTTLMA